MTAEKALVKAEAATSWAPSTAATDCVVCCEPFATLAAGLPSVERAYSTLLCRMSGEPIHEDNPPLVLPGGHVHSQAALAALAAADGSLVDPHSGERVRLAELRRAYFL